MRNNTESWNWWFSTKSIIFLYEDFEDIYFIEALQKLNLGEIMEVHIFLFKY